MKVGPAVDGDFNVTDTSCAIDGPDGLAATGTITNTSSQAQAFQIKIRFVSVGRLVAEEFTITETIDAGRSADYRVGAFAADAPVDTTCDDVSVNYATSVGRNDGT